MSEKVYSYSFDEERYHGEFDTIVEAIDEARAEEPEATVVYVGENISPDPVRLVDADLVLEHILNHDEYMNEWAEDWPDASKEQKQELTEMLQNTFKVWLDTYNLHPNFFNIENAKKYDIPQVEVV